MHFLYIALIFFAMWVCALHLFANLAECIKMVVEKEGRIQQGAMSVQVMVIVVLAYSIHLVP